MDRQLELELQDNGILLERVAPRKTLWAEYEPWPFIQDGIEYNARVTLGEDLKGRALYLIILHELAHHLTDQKQSYGLRPHGKEWQAIYKELVEKYLYLFDGVDVLSLFIPRYTAKKENELLDQLQA